MFVSVSKFGRYETKNGVQSPPRATGFPSREISISDIASASDDTSSTLKSKRSLRIIYKIAEVRNITNLTFANHYCQDTTFVILACGEIPAVLSCGSFLNSVL